MTLTDENVKSAPKSGFAKFRFLAARFLGATFGLICVGYGTGYGIAGGLGSLMMVLPKALPGAMLVSLIAGWVPLGFYYEGHRCRWLYIIAYGLATLVIAGFIGHSMGAANEPEPPKNLGVRAAWPFLEETAGKKGEGAGLIATRLPESCS